MIIKKIKRVLIVLAIFTGMCILGYTSCKEALEDSSVSSSVEESIASVIIEEPEPVAQEMTCTFSEEEKDYIIRVIMSEARGESIIGQMAVAQCILDGSVYYDCGPTELCKKLSYAGPYKKCTSEDGEYLIAEEAFEKVFVTGVRVVPDRIIYFYDPSRCTSKWHETQKYITTIGCHRFFDAVN